MNKLGIIFPVYNERNTIEKVLSEWKSHLAKFKIDYIFIICEDGSTDGTAEFLKEIQKKYKLILDQVKYRRGYGSAVIDGIRRAQSVYILCVDSDGQCDPKDFKKFWDKREKSDILIGWRKKRADNKQRKIFSKMFNTFFKIIFYIKIHDPSAPYVLFKKKTISPHIKYLRFLKEGFWWGFIGTCSKKNLKIREIPINHRDRFAGDTQVYKINKIPSIAIRNLLGLIRLKLTK